MNTNYIKKRVILLFVIYSSFNEILFCQPNFKKIFSDNEVCGSIIILDYLNDKYYEYNPKRNDSTYLPASTFKILNSLIALELSVISDENEIIRWDGIEREYHKWNTDHNLRSAFKYSVVWFYKKLARKVGKELMRNYVRLSGYGNENIGGDIDSFWLNGNLRISPKQQIDFLVKSYNNSLPFSHHNISIVKDIFTVEKTNEYILSAKTGWANNLEK